MKWLLDTNVVSEWVKPRPDTGVIRWLEAADEDELFLSVVTLAELWHGVERLDGGKRKALLQRWLRDDLTERFEGRILSFEERIAEAWGRLMAKSEAAGRRFSVMDGFLAATAEVHELTLVTRDVEGFSGLFGDVYNPWEL